LEPGVPQSAAFTAHNTVRCDEASTPQARPKATKTPGQQLSLIDAELETAAFSGNAAAATSEHAVDPMAPRPNHRRARVQLKAPLRLDPAVRDALAQAVAAFDQAPGDTDVCTIAEGVFVPLTEFERHGLLPSLALRALQEAKMLKCTSTSTSGTPTLTRNVHGTPMTGLILDPKHIEGLEASTFARASRQANEVPGSQHPVHAIPTSDSTGAPMASNDGAQI